MWAFAVVSFLIGAPLAALAGGMVYKEE
jgi:hypothetical protein